MSSFAACICISGAGVNWIVIVRCTHHPGQDRCSRLVITNAGIADAGDLINLRLANSALLILTRINFQQFNIIFID